MSYLVLSRKWRPDKFEKLIGQDHISKTLLNAIELNKVAHAYLFTGSRGVGKTTAARILAKELNNTNIDKIASGQNLDIIELDGASNRGIDEIRDIKESVKYPPSSGKYRIFIIDEVHMLTEPAFNALLKTLEEPPTYVIFIMATTEPQKIPQTIISRSQRFDFRRLSIDNIRGHLTDIMNKENIDYEEEVLNMIALKSDGSMRDALSYLDQLIVYSNNKLTFSDASYILGVIDYSKFISIMDLLFNQKISDIIKTISEVIDSGVSINNFINGFINFIRDVLLLDTYKTQSTYRESMLLISNRFSSDKLLLIVNLLQSLHGKLKSIDQPRISLELLFLKLDSEINGTIKSKIQEKKEQNKKPGFSNDNSNKSSDIKYNEDKTTQEVKLSDSKILEHVPINSEDLSGKWAKAISVISKIKPNIASILEDSILSIDGDNIIIKLTSSYDFDFNQIEKNKSIIEEYLFESKYSTKKNIIIVKNESNHEKQESQSNNHPLLSDALESFNGEIER